MIITALYQLACGLCTNTSAKLLCASTNTFIPPITEPFSGLVGLAYQALNQATGSPLFDLFYGNTAVCPSSVVGYYLPANKSTGEITVCGINSNHYSGEISWVPLIAQDYWRFTLAGISVGGSQVVNAPVVAILDTGNSRLLGPNTTIVEILQYLGLPSTYVNGGTLYCE